MACGRNSADPIVTALYNSDDLMLLKRGFPQRDFRVGQVLVKLPRNSSFLVDTDRLFAPWEPLETRRSKYVRLTAHDWSSRIAADAGAELAATLGGHDGEKFAADAKAAFSAANAENFRVALANAWLMEVQPDEVHQRLSSTSLMPAAVDYIERGGILCFVTAVLTVTSARLELGASANVEGSASFSTAWLEKAGLRGKVENAQSRTYVLEPTEDRPVVIAFRCLELSFDDGQYLGVARPEEPVPHRQLDAFPAAHHATVSEEDSAFVEVQSTSG